jgi:glycosyltransferase involved in cell wall biosynthesis
MRVLMINRADARHVSGGDVIQLDKTRGGLQALGVSVDVRLADELVGPWKYDLVHIFNIQSPDGSWEACQIAKSKGLPVALSPIYWNFTESWYWTNPALNPAWRVMRASVGKRGYPVYARWQHLRSRASETWRVQQRLLLAADVILPNSRLEAAEICKDFRLGDSTLRFAVVPNAIDRHLFEDITPSSSQKESILKAEGFVMEVGRLSPEKNCLALMQALWDIDVAIIFVGQASPYAPEYAEACRERGRQRGKVHFLAWVSHEQLPGIYARAAVHALPSWRETPGLVSLEAAAAGCRIVSTSIGSAREYFGDDAWYCHPADQGSIRDAVLRALNAEPSPGLRRRILDNYTWDKAAEITLAAYRSILEH